MRRIPVLKLLLMATSLLIATASVGQSNNLWCDGTVSNLWIDHGGNAFVLPSWRADHIRVCNVQSDVGTITPTTCLTWVSLLRSAVQRGARTTIFYTGTGVPAACNQMLTYSLAPLPYYVMLNN
jgi:hypothetical protein